jgi:hypothetical protein
MLRAPTFQPSVLQELFKKLKEPGNLMLKKTNNPNENLYSLTFGT